MKKYLAIFKISLAQEFAYRANFIMWRVRNVFQIFLIFFLWDAVFRGREGPVFGYDRARILSYVFGILIVKAIVFSSRSIDIAGEISRAELSNYLLKPLNYLKYWFSRDISSKVLNLFFAFFETLILYLILKPSFFLQTDPFAIIIFLLSLVFAIFLYYYLVLVFSIATFWFPEQGWGMIFLLMMFANFLSGGVFPIDILPSLFQKILYATPFPYLIFMPLQIYLGKIDPVSALSALTVSALWIVILGIAVRKFWNRGLMAYKAEGR